MEQLVTALIQLFLLIWGFYFMLYALKVVNTPPAEWAGRVIGRTALFLIRLPFLVIAFLVIGGVLKALSNRTPRRRRIEF